jgi:hypothetical protein
MTPKSTKRNRYFVFVRVVSWLRLLIAPLFLGYWQLENIFFQKMAKRDLKNDVTSIKMVAYMSHCPVGQGWDKRGTTVGHFE